MVRAFFRRGLAVFTLISASTHAAAPVGAWWDQTFAWRRKVTVTARAAFDGGYSIPVPFDHLAQVNAGRAQADGTDVRLVLWTGEEWTPLHRVLDTGSAFNRASTVLWTSLPSGLEAGAATDDLYLYWSNPDAGAPLADPNRVFLFFDDFEGGDLSKWSEVPASGLWSLANDRVHQGNAAVKYPQEGQSSEVLTPAGAFDESDVFLEAWWNTSGPNFGRYDVALIVRATDFTRYTASCMFDQEAELGWVIGRATVDTFSRLTPHSPNPAATANSWHRFGFGVHGNRGRAFRDGVQFLPANGAADVSSCSGSGRVGLHKWELSNPGNAWWVDDVVLRRYVDPEPTVSLSPSESIDGGTEGGGAGGGDPGARLIGPPRDFSVGCGCGQAGWTSLAALIVALRWLTRSPPACCRSRPRSLRSR